MPMLYGTAPTCVHEATRKYLLRFLKTALQNLRSSWMGILLLTQGAI